MENKVTYEMLLKAKQMLEDNRMPTSKLCYFYKNDDELEEMKKIYKDTIEYKKMSMLPNGTSVLADKNLINKPFTIEKW